MDFQVVSRQQVSQRILTQPLPEQTCQSAAAGPAYISKTIFLTKSLCYTCAIGNGDAEEEGKDDGSNCGGPQRGVGQDVGLGGFRSQGPRLFHQPPTTPPPPAPAAAVHWLCGRTFWKCTRGDPLAGGSAGSGTLGLAATPSFGLHITAVITAHRNACSRHTYSLRWK